MKKFKKIIINIILIIVFILGIYFSYTNFMEIHTNFCCIDLEECPIYVCSSTSNKLTDFELYAFLFFFCLAGIFLEIINLLRNILLK